MKNNLTEKQDQAANPNENVWVQANAGTGKTSVLVQRLLRILFRSPEPLKSGVLCLTYTNAAAGEMRNRILKEMQKWASGSNDELRELLDGVSVNKIPSTNDIAYARKMFFIFIDNPDMLKIKTIHGFCEEILHRFPIEAGVKPTWSLVSDENQRVLLSDAFDRLLLEKNDVVERAFMHLVNRISEYSMPKLLGILSGQYKDFFGVENFVKYREYFVEKTQEILNLKKYENNADDTAKLKVIVRMCQDAQKARKTPLKSLENIITLTNNYIENRIDFEKYKTGYLTKDGGKIQNIQKIEFLMPEQDRIYNIEQHKNNQIIFDDTMALFDLSAAFARKYMELKYERGVLDFEDLILYTRKLFSNPENMGWVLSQLDVSLSHILVDEAQDTGPMQWDIMRMLAGDFFADGSTESTPRSLFVVGDTKQSIYGFMGADPNAFAKSREMISQQIKNNLRTIQEIPLAQSFRSLSSILYAVDTFFENPDVRSVSDFVNNEHVCFRKDGHGLVEINKLVSKQETGVSVLEYVKTIAEKIKSMIESGDVKASDIMVLVQRRTPFVAPLVAQLKRMQIPVAGSDRIVLPEFPAIRDLLNLLRFCITNSDDYSLCCVLKSPLYRFSEKDICDLCVQKNEINRERTAKDKDAPKITVFEVLANRNPDVYQDLLKIIDWAKIYGPYSFFTSVLNNNGMRARMIVALGDQIIDPLEEFITICLSYERTQPGTLKHFLKWFITGGSEIKRDMDASSGVRIMTIHGSKGLQSKVVFLIDTVKMPESERVIPVGDTWLWTGGSGTHCDAYDCASTKFMRVRMAEYYRLLYVAMTRACDELYIYGYTPNKNAPENCWHSRLWNVFANSEYAPDDSGIIRIVHE